jgi:hypothetical protein
MNPNAVKYLKSVADSLPMLVDTSKNVYVEKTGAELIESGTLKDKYNVDINPKRKYLIKVPAFVDHLKHLKYVWQRGKGEDQKKENVEFYKQYIANKFTNKKTDEVSA